ncbi:Uncharacterized protein APZ42_005444, partial [Daphnia magna]
HTCCCYCCFIVLEKHHAAAPGQEIQSLKKKIEINKVRSEKKKVNLVRVCVCSPPPTTPSR